jgi:hypothetical protein
MHARPDATDCNESKLAIVTAGIRRQLRIVPVEANNGGKIDTVPGKIGGALGLILIERTDLGHVYLYLQFASASSE